MAPRGSSLVFQVIFQGITDLAQRAGGHLSPSDLGPLAAVAQTSTAQWSTAPTPDAPRDQRILWLARHLILGQAAPASPAQALHPPLSVLKLNRDAAGEPLVLPTLPLKLERTTIFPAQDAPQGSLTELWHELRRDLSQVPAARPGSDYAQAATLLALICKHLSQVPATQDADISLHAAVRTIAAVAVAIEHGLPDPALDACIAAVQIGATSPASPVAVILRGDLSGIQEFIFRVTRFRSDATYRHVARRLRGRSFSLIMLGELLAEAVLRDFDLPPTNLLFCGGGHFDILLPLDAAAALPKLRQRMEQVLLHQFGGALALQVAHLPVTPEDLRDMGPCYRTLDDLLDQGKTRRFRDSLSSEDLYLPQTPQPERHACPACAGPWEGPDVCPACKEHQELGGRLPRAAHLAVCSGLPQQPAGWTTSLHEDLGASYGLFTDEQAKTLLTQLRDQPDHPPVVLYRLNDTDFLRPDAPSGTGLGFRFVANAAPVARHELDAKVPGIDPVNPDEVLPFEYIARLGQGTALLGVLKADVDHLGLLLSAAEGGSPRGLARLATLSQAIELFFCGWLNKICEDYFAEWRKQGHRWADEVEGLFYTIYAGGDDLLVIGPWDAILHLAARLQAEFSAFACHNRNVTLSAGVVLVKPRYPVHRFSKDVDAALKQAKHRRDQICVLGRSLDWSYPDGTGFRELLQLGQALLERVESGNPPFPRTLVHDLLRLYQRHRPAPDAADQRLKPMWTPRFFYTLARRLAPQDRQVFGRRLLDAITKQVITIPAAYVSYASRKES